MSGTCIKEIQSYIKHLFLSGQNDLQSREFDKESAGAAESRHRVLNKFKLMVLTNAVCVDILVWATKDENGEILFYFFEKILTLMLSQNCLYSRDFCSTGCVLLAKIADFACRDLLEKTLKITFLFSKIHRIRVIFNVFFNKCLKMKLPNGVFWNPRCKQKFRHSLQRGLKGCVLHPI